MRKLIFFLIATLLFSCNEPQSNKGFAPMAFGDSTLIVTETDQQYLGNNVIDIEQRFVPQEETPAIDSVTPIVTKPEEPKTDTIASNSETPTAPRQNAKGFTLKITPEASIVFVGIEAKELKQQNAIKENSLSYLQTEGDLLLSQLVLEGATDITIQQRYQSKVSIKHNKEILALSSLGKHTSDWKTVKVTKNSSETLNKTAISNPQFPNLNNAKLKAAVDKTLKNQRAKQAEKNQWHNAIKKVKSANDAPCEITLDNVQWIIKGKDKAGIPFQKNIRLDVR